MKVLRSISLIVLLLLIVIPASAQDIDFPVELPDQIAEGRDVQISVITDNSPYYSNVNTLCIFNSTRSIMFPTSHGIEAISPVSYELLQTEPPPCSTNENLDGCCGNDGGLCSYDRVLIGCGACHQIYAIECFCSGGYHCHYDYLYIYDNLCCYP